MSSRTADAKNVGLDLQDKWIFCEAIYDNFHPAILYSSHLVVLSTSDVIFTAICSMQTYVIMYNISDHVYNILNAVCLFGDNINNHLYT